MGSGKDKRQEKNRSRFLGRIGMTGQSADYIDFADGKDKCRFLDSLRSLGMTSTRK